MQIKFVDYMFMPGHTIKAIIRSHNNMISDVETLELLLNKFNEVNNNEIPRPGQRFKIPVIDK